MAFAAMFQGTAAPEHVDAVKTALAQLARESVQEPGTIRCEFYQFSDDPAVFLLFGVWEEEADWRAHVEGDAHVRYVNSSPAGAWAIRPAMTRLTALELST